MKVKKKYLILAVLFLILNLITATQYAVTKVDYLYTIVHPSNASIRYIGSDNSSDGERVLRVTGDNSTSLGLQLKLGDMFSTDMTRTFSAAFALVNEENYPVNITHINVSSVNHSYLKIWLHGNRTANANSTANDPTTVLMWDNNSIINVSSTTAWTLAAGNSGPNNMSADGIHQIATPWDKVSCVRYSRNNTNAASGVSDFVWVQISIEIPHTIDLVGDHTGTIWIHLESEAGN